MQSARRQCASPFTAAAAPREVLAAFAADEHFAAPMRADTSRFPATGSKHDDDGDSIAQHRSVKCDRQDGSDIAYAVHAICGMRDRMEDDFITTRINFHGETAFLFAVFDGHRGAGAARFCAENLSSYVEDEARQTTGPDEGLDQFGMRVMEAALMKADAGYAKAFEEESVETGTTAVAAVVSATHIWHGHCGDSRVVLCRDGAALDLSADHHLRDHESSRQERERITAAGGSLFWDRMSHTYRVGFRGLNMSRAIGDKCYEGIVIPNPDTSCTPRTPLDEFLIFASDGLWNVMESSEAVAFVRDRQCRGCPLHQTASELVNEALRSRASTDNITAMIVLLR